MVRERRKDGKRIVGVALVSFILCCQWLLAPEQGVAAQPTNSVIQSNTLKIGTKKEHQEWLFIRDHQMGIAGRDLLGHKIHCPPAEKFFFDYDNWFPNSGWKETLCGKLDHFNFYEPTWIAFSEEMDWNNFFVPSSTHKWLLDQLLNAMQNAGLNLNEWHTCGSSYCMEGEVTPYQGFYNPPENPWFPKNKGVSDLEGCNLCTYGPWVREKVHNWRPEIHPSELYWWKSEPASSCLVPKDAAIEQKINAGELDVYFMIMVWDDSNRFNDASSFDFDCGNPPGWRPWASPQHDFEFRLAFEVDLSQTIITPRHYVIQITRQHNLVQGYGDMDDGTTHDLIYDGRPVLKVTEQGNGTDNLGVGFDFRRNQANTRLEGYVSIAGRVTSDAYLVLRVLEYPEVAVDILPILGYPIEEIKPHAKVALLDPDCFRYIELLGLRLNCFLLKVFREGDLSLGNIEKISLKDKNTGEERDLEFTVEEDASGDLTASVFGEVSVLEGLELTVALSGGTLIETKTNEVRLAPIISTDRPLATRQVSAAIWPQMLAAAGLPGPGTVLPAREVTAVDTWQFELMPLYAPVRAGFVSREEESLLGERLTEAIIDGDVGELMRYFGTTEPISVEWEFSARSPAMNEAVNVLIFDELPNTPSDNEVMVATKAGFIPNGVVEVAFPQRQDQRVYLLTATAVLTDTIGNRVELQHRVWSHAVTGPSPDQLVTGVLPSLAEMVEVPPHQFLDAARPGAFRDEERLIGAWVTAPRIAAAESTRLVATQAAADSLLTMDELKLVFGQATTYADPPIADEDRDGVPDSVDLCPGGDDRFLDVECNDGCLSFGSNLSIPMPCFDLFPLRFGITFNYLSGLFWEVNLESLRESTGGGERYILEDDFSIRIPCLQLNGIRFSCKLNYVGGLVWEGDLGSVVYLE
jgi:hypothetical protein